MRLIIRGVIGAALLCLGSSAFAVDFGRTTGSFAVSPGGAATYSVPIWTPPGPNGVTPSISLNYNSQSGNGVGGVGWNLSAVASIERCTRTKHQDGNAEAIHLTLNDRFCIGGNRLRLQSGTYGVAGSVYYTEIADYSRITAYGTAGNGPQYFVVEAKSGLKYEYGNTTSSRVIPGGTTVLRWMLSKVYDRSSNNYVISYNNTTGFAVPDVISWTPTSFGAPTYRYEAKFNYINNRADKDSYLGKVAGFDVANRYRLENIQIKSAGAVVRKYRFAYATSPVTALSRMTSAKECADDAETNCFLPITFTYQAGQVGVTPGSGSVPVNSSAVHYGRYDLNGDGKNDVLYVNAGICYAAFGANLGFSGPYNTGLSTCGIADRFLPNGRSAIAISISGVLWIYRWDDATSAFVGYNTGVSQGGGFCASDYDGDDLADLV